MDERLISLPKNELIQLYRTNLNTIVRLSMEIENLKTQNEELKRDKKKNELDEKVDCSTNTKERNDALLKLHCCHQKANDKFKCEYRKYFGLSKYYNAPDLGQFIDDPPMEITDKTDFDFWKKFCNDYPNSDNKDFRQIHLKINAELIQCGVYYVNGNCIV